MQEIMAIAAGAVAAAGASMALFSTGIAAADNPDVVGKTYSDAQTAFQNANLTPVVATVVGDKLPQSDCYVASTSKPTFNDQSGASKGDMILVNLNCYPKPAAENQR
jgi:hypothetical protein